MSNFKFGFIRPLLFLTLLAACKHDKPGSALQEVEPTLTAKNPLMQLLSPDRTGIDFQNHIVESFENNITTNINMYNGGGMAIVDVNNDGLPDIYFGCSNGKNRMYLNEGGLKFRDITDASGLASEDGFETAVTAADVNGDGFVDFYICRGGVEINDARRNKLYINNGNLTFTERSHEFGLDDKSASTGANFFDYDNDGDLDMYLLNYPTEAIYTNKIEARLAPDGKTYVPELTPRAEFDSDRLYRNEGNGKFTDVSQKAGIWNLAYGLSVSITDFNRDGWPDIYVGNDFIQPDLLYINNHDGTFTNRLDQYFKHTSQHTMGTDLSDFDNDGLVDLYAVDMLSHTNYRKKSFLATNTLNKYLSMVQHGYFEPVVRNVLQHNNGNGTFTDVACMGGVFDTDWSWSGLLFDMDNDGLRDLHVTNGYRREVTNRDFIEFTLPEIKKHDNRRLRDIYPNFDDFLRQLPTYKIRNFIYQNQGNFQFKDVGGDWATMPASWSCGSAWADLDKDGDLDLVTNNLEDPAFVYENTARTRPNSNFLQVKFQGDKPNTQAVGASVAIFYGGGQRQFFENFPVRGIFSTVETLAHFGLGNVGTVDKLVVRWPNGKTQSLANVPANQQLTLKQTDATGSPTPSIAPVTEPSRTYLQDITAGAGFNWTHEENEFNDFENWLLNPWTETDLGPFLADADVNGDGKEDFFVGNCFDKPAALFLQDANGHFHQSNTALWQAEKLYEDHGALFFDADMDGDLDLFVISGGMEATAPEAWQHRLYLNDGKGNFSKANGAIPAIPQVGSRVVAYDYDGDGDGDLLVGGRVTGAKWPLTPRSLVLRNDKGKFTDVSAQVGGDFQYCGMVTDLQVANLDGEANPEIVVVGEFMPVMVFKMVGGKLTNVSANFGFEKSNGLWNRLSLNDFDGDGDMDLVTGNFGLNTRLRASAEGPLRVFAKDFDGNGTLDPVVAYYEDGKCYPLNQKDLLNKQMPILKKKYLYASEFGHATIDMLWPQKDLDAAVNLFAYTFETCWWENQNGKFVRHSLPAQAQIAPVQGILTSDFNGDGHPDILLAGNKYGLEVETNRCDGGTGCLLAGDGKGNFTFVPNVLAGFWAQRECRDLGLIDCCGNQKVLVANNHGPLQLFRLNK